MIVRKGAEMKAAENIREIKREPYISWRRRNNR